VKKHLLSALACLAITPSCGAEHLKNENNISPNVPEATAQHNRLAFARREVDINKLLNSATRFPAYYDVSEVPSEENIVLIMLRHKFSEHWRVQDVTRKVSSSDSSLKHFWEITPRKSETN
jgi:plasmid replication initiation protein